jgi:putative chitinase
MLDANVTALQCNLQSRGYSPGGIDGDFGPLTLLALLAFTLSQSQTAALKVHAVALAPAMNKGGIIGRYRVAHFLANIIHETQRLTRLVENLRYSDPARLDGLFSHVRNLQHATQLIKAGPIAIANCAYAGVNGNGDEVSGDGYRYCGEGYLMHTGRRNYADLRAETGIDFVTKPELLQQPGPAAIAAVAFWNANLLSVSADKNDAGEVRQGINGRARLDLDKCQAFANRILSVWP